MNTENEGLSQSLASTATLVSDEDENDIATDDDNKSVDLDEISPQTLPEESNTSVPALKALQVTNGEAGKVVAEPTTCPPTFESLQEIVGNSGIWQLKILVLSSFSGFCLALHVLIYGFIGVVPDHWCTIPNLALENSVDELRQKLTSNLSEQDSHCYQHPWKWDHVTNTLTVDNSTAAHCRKFQFAQAEFESTVPSEFQLVCENANWAPYMQMTYIIGSVIGAPFFGVLSDRLGRKPALLMASLLCTVVGPLISFAPNFTIFLILRFVLALSLPGLYDISYVLGIEIVSERWRAFAGNYFNIPFALGYAFLAVLAYFIRSWRYLQVACSLPSFLFLAAWCFLPESPRWLIRKGRLVEAEQILRQGAKCGEADAKNADVINLMKSIYEQEREDKTERHSITEYLNIWKSPRMCAILLTLCLCWLTIGVTYYGLGLNATNLSTDKYMYFFVNGLLEIPGYIMAHLFIKWFGRKPVFIGFMWTCGVALLISVCLPEGSLYIIFLSFLSKFVVTANFSVIYLYSSEMLPTDVRNFALSLCAMMGQIGSALAPIIDDIVGRGHKMYPSLIFGSLAIVAGVISLILPETQNCALPDAKAVEATGSKRISAENSHSAINTSTQVLV